jgi:probable addiction module antidote protein
MLALRDVLRSRVFQQVAEEAGVSRESLHRTLTSARDARLSTLVKVLRVVGCRLAVTTIGTTKRKRVPKARRV